MSAAENKATVLRFGEEVPGKGNLDYIDEVVTDDFVWHGTGVRGREALKQHMAAFRSGVLGLKFEPVDQIAEGNRVATRYAVSGTMKGDFFGIPPTGEHATWTGIMICGFTDGGKFSEMWVSEDMFQMLVQFGVIDSPWPGDD